MPEIHQAFQVVQRPAGFQGMPLVARIGAHRCIAGLERTVNKRGIHDRADEAGTATHGELAVPFIR
jgi:hypothetical protein